jgi:hypothetical protein
MVAPVPAQAQTAPAPKHVPKLPPELSDPAMADKLGKMAGALTKALMNMPVGELEAAIQGREPTAADKNKRVRDEIGGPDAERNIEARVAHSGKQMQAMSKALVDSLPSIMSAMDDVEKNLDHVTANIPDPTYPKR